MPATPAQTRTERSSSDDTHASRAVGGLGQIAAPYAAVAGALAAGAALAAGEVVTAALGSGPSLVTAVGTEFIDRFAASLKDLAVALFGTNDKAALIVGIVVVSVVLGAAIGVAARTRWPIAPLGFGAFGALGAWILAGDPQGSAPTAIAAATVAAVAGIGALTVLLRIAPRTAASVQTLPTDPDDEGSRGAVDTGTCVSLRPDPPRPAAARQTTIDRRRFLLGAGSLIVVTGASTVLARRLRSANGVDAIRRSTVLPRPWSSTVPPRSQPFTVSGLTPYVTPNDDFYRIDTALRAPRVDADSWTLSITGLVDRPFELGYDELLALDSVEETVTIACVSNEVGGSLIGNAVWQGVPLPVLLDRAGVRPEATQVVGRSVDRWTAGFPTAHAVDGRTALVAYAMNGEPLPVAHGYPARLIVAGLYGYVSATKWLQEIELTTWDGFDAYWIPRGWAKEGPIKTASRIDVPRHGERLRAGPQPIAGVAWAPHRGIHRVEVQIDDGPWHECELGRVAGDDTWVQWRFVWDATAGDHTVRARAADGEGVTQTSDVSRPAPDGATGWHTRRFHVE